MSTIERLRRKISDRPRSGEERQRRKDKKITKEQCMILIKELGRQGNDISKQDLLNIISEMGELGLDITPNDYIKVINYINIIDNIEKYKVDEVIKDYNMKIEKIGPYYSKLIRGENKILEIKRGAVNQIR